MPNIYDYDSLTALQFDRVEGLDALIDRFWTDPDLRNIPRAHVGRNTIIVPTVIVDSLTAAGFVFSASPVAKPA